MAQPLHMKTEFFDFFKFTSKNNDSVRPIFPISNSPRFLLKCFNNGRTLVHAQVEKEHQEKDCLEFCWNLKDNMDKMTLFHLSGARA